VSHDARPAPELLDLVRAEARRIARRIPAGGPTFDDLVGFGHLGLVEATNQYDPTHGVHFETFARHRIRGAIFDGLRSQGLFSRRAYEDLRRHAIAHEVLEEPGRDAPPSRADDAAAVTSAVAQLAMAFLTEATLVGVEPAEDAETRIADDETREELRAALHRLPPEDRELIEAVYDFREVGDSGAALARRQGVTRSYISRRHRQILERLRRVLASESGP
jgi:RNA polymerase sigma factor for flagellar operon FliA